MPIPYDAAIRIEIEKGTLGGDTYFVTTKENPGKEKALCFRPLPKKNYPEGDTRDLRCANPAGAKTSHEGEGACNFHGGEAGRPPTNGRASFKTRKGLNKRIHEFMASREELMDLSYELSASRAIFQEMMESFPTVNDEDFGIQLQRLTNLIGTTGSLVEKISKTESRATLTAAHVAYLQACMVDLFMKYIVDPRDRELAIQDLYSRVQINQFSTTDRKQVRVVDNDES